MIILPDNINKPLVAIYHGDRKIECVLVGTELVWLEANLHGIRSASLCKTHSAFVLNNGTLWTCGSNLHGQLCEVRPSGSWHTPNLAQVPGITDAISVAVSCNVAGEGSTVVLREHGRLHSAGASPTLAVSATQKIAYSALGRQSVSGSPVFSNFAEVLGTYYVQKIWHGRGRLFIHRSDGVYGYGLDWDANRATFQWMPVRDPGGKTLVCSDLSAHALSPAVLRSDGSVLLLGPIADWHRPQGFPNSQTNVLQPSLDDRFLDGIRKLTTGQSHLAAITGAGFLRTAGSDRYGQLCSVKYQYRNPYRGYVLDDVPAADVACGDNHTVILCRNGRVKTGGRNNRGQLGRAVPVGNGHDWLYFVGEDHVMQEGWYGNMDDIPEIDDAVAVYAGGDSTVIICRSGIVVCGDNEFGQLGVRTEKHFVNSSDRNSWRESWQGSRTPFLTNRQTANLFSDENLTT